MTKSYGEEKLIIGKRYDSDTGTPKEEIIKYLHDPSWEDEISEFTDAILNDKPILHGNSNDTLQTMKLVYKIYCSDENWKNKYNLTS